MPVELDNVPLRVVSAVGFSNSSGKPVVVANIGVKGTVFAGTFNGRTSYYGWDFVMRIYTVKSGALYAVYDCGATNMEVVRIDAQTLNLQLNSANPVGTLKYDPSTGDFTIIGASGGTWLEGTLMGTYAAVT
jgi:glucose dehydrogenase